MKVQRKKKQQPGSTKVVLMIACCVVAVLVVVVAALLFDVGGDYHRGQQRISSSTTAGGAGALGGLLSLGSYTAASAGSIAGGGGGGGGDVRQLLQRSIDRYKIHVPENVKLADIEKSSTTIVTAHLRIPTSPPTDTFYAYVSHLLTVQDNMIIFTSTDMVERMKLLRSLWPSKTVIVEMQLDDVPISELGGGGKYWSDQLDMDPEQQRRIMKQDGTTTGNVGDDDGDGENDIAEASFSPKLYWTPLSRSWFVKEAIRFNYFDSSYYVWTDIELFKTKKYLNKKIVRNVPSNVPTNSILWMSRSVPDPPENPIVVPGSGSVRGGSDREVSSVASKTKTTPYHIGNMGAGTANAWLDLHDKYAATLQQFVQTKQSFVGNADAVLQATCQLYVDNCRYALASDVDDVATKASLRTVLHVGKNKNGKKFKLYQGKKYNHDDDGGSNSNNKGNKKKRLKGIRKSIFARVG